MASKTASRSSDRPIAFTAWAIWSFALERESVTAAGMFSSLRLHERESFYLLARHDLTHPPPGQIQRQPDLVWGCSELQQQQHEQVLHRFEFFYRAVRHSSIPF